MFAHLFPVRTIYFTLNSHRKGINVEIQLHELMTQIFSTFIRFIQIEHGYELNFDPFLIYFGSVLSMCFSRIVDSIVNISFTPQRVHVCWYNILIPRIRGFIEPS